MYEEDQWQNENTKHGKGRKKERESEVEGVYVFKPGLCIVVDVSKWQSITIPTIHDNKALIRHLSHPNTPYSLCFLNFFPGACLNVCLNIVLPPCSRTGLFKHVELEIS